jgi:hypothetical protein
VREIVISRGQRFRTVQEKLFKKVRAILLTNDL